jgi:hypothetical protein
MTLIKQKDDCMMLIKRLLLVVVAAGILGGLVSTASATRLSLSSQTFRATFSSLHFSGGFGTVECALTIEGSWHGRTFAKTGGSLIGYVTRATLGACSRGSATILTASLPWHRVYSGYFGVLPAIQAYQDIMIGMQIQIREPVFGVTCLASGGSVTAIFRRLIASGELNQLELIGRSPTNCGIEGTLSGTSSSLTVLNASTRITLTLI